ncbi:AAA family ATPase [Heyndrickxia coagulans]|uniref:AAA family ATPase n=1 Tax=Heyndrickxia coagulans TaxID=1398 RepID=UPI001459EDD8|nr:AAA family ATPase [Heyndrickxia coagulans]NMH83293.1 AAA family ATPase [Heyndrickxia coagulans]
MTIIKLDSLEISNFKGIRHFTLHVNGQNTKIYGDNATGKTTIFDAFNWLLFDKDSQNKKEFALKTLDKDGNELHNLEHSVKAVLLVDGRSLTLAKAYKENWTKKRGSATAEFSGHTTKYYIDGVPVKKKEYTDKIKSMIDEDIFKLLTSPSYFNEQVKWQDRRKTLLEICGDLTDEEVIASAKSLEKLPTILQGRSIEDHRKIIAARRSEINKELDRIPVRIDEIQRSLPELDGLNQAALEAEIKQLNDQIDEKMTIINNIKNGKAVTEKEKAVQVIEMELMEIQRNHDSDAKEQLYKLKARIQEEESNLSILLSKLENLKTKKRYNDENIKRIEETLASLRNEWKEVNVQTFQHTDECTCPTCGQDLPADQVEAAREKALAQFNLKKAKRLEELNDMGQKGAAKKQEMQAENDKLSEEFAKLSAQVFGKKSLLEKLAVQLEQQEGLITDVLDNPKYIEKLRQKKAIQEEIKVINEQASEAIGAIQIEIMKLRDKRDQLQAEMGKFDLFAQAQQRIEDLSEQEKDLAAEFEKLEQELYLTEEFIRTKVNLLEEKINSKFKYARFKLFDQQINGGLVEVCETTYKGVPYGSGLNNAARINVGLDIINTLSKHYGFTAPIFIDNREAVTRLIDTDAQTISLIVSEADKELRVETTSELMKEAI